MDGFIDKLLYPLEYLLGIQGHAQLDRSGPGYNTILLRSIPGDLYIVCPHRQFHALPRGNTVRQWGSLYNLYDGFWDYPGGIGSWANSRPTAREA